MKNLLFFLALTGISALATAQIPQSLLEPAEEIHQFDNYQGAIYNSLRFKPASIIEEKSGAFDTELRYNAYSDIMEHKKGENLFQIKKDPEVHIRLDDEYFYYCLFKTERFVPAEGYYVLVDLNEKYGVYKKYSLKITEPKKYGGPDGTPTPGIIKMETTYYLEENGFIRELPMNKNSMLAAFEDKKEELKLYMKKEKIKLRNEEDLIQLVSKYNMLKNNNTGPSRSLLGNRDLRN